MKKCALGIMVFLVCVILTIGLYAGEDLIYVIERGNYADTGELSKIEGTTITTLAGGLRDPLDVKLLPNGNLIVSEHKSYSLKEYTREGLLVGIYSILYRPVDIFIDIDGAIYVATYNGGILKADSDWNFSPFVSVPGNLADMVRLGDYFYVVSWPGALFRVNPADKTYIPLYADSGGGYVGLTVLGDDLLITEYSRNKIIRVSNLMSTPTVADFAVGLTRASHFATDGKGNFILSHQITPGGFSKITSSGSASTYLDDTYDLTNPREFVFLCIATIDIKPGSDPNSINLGEHGLLPVAILGSADFDVETIEPATIQLGGATLAARGSEKKSKLAYSYEDTNGDGNLDMMTFFDVQGLVAGEVLMEGTTELLITATLKDGTPIEGTDFVNIVN